MENMGVKNPMVKLLDKIILEEIRQIANKIKTEASVLERKTLLVLGGCGFIGSYFLNTIYFLNENFFANPCSLVCVDNLITGKKSNLAHLMEKKYFRFIRHDISVPLRYRGKIDFIVHAASIASPVTYRKYPLKTIEVNVFGTYNLLKMVLKQKIQSFLCLSSSEVYGDPSIVPMPETYWGNVSFTGPRACYDESKRLSETLCMIFYNTYNVPIKIARPFNVYGPGLPLDDGRVIPDFLNNALRGEPIVMYSDGRATRSFCYISDAVTGFFKILLSDYNGEAFNVGNDWEEISINELANLIKELFEGKPEIVRRKSMDKNYLKDVPQRRCPDITKIKKFLNYEPEVDLKSGLRRLIGWYKLTYNL
jgi:dTDP-glucose 4,6-dehydratase/UDP-glucuronate decarboxylase